MYQLLHLGEEHATQMLPGLRHSDVESRSQFKEHKQSHRISGQGWTSRTSKVTLQAGESPGAQ